MIGLKLTYFSVVLNPPLFVASDWFETHLILVAISFVGATDARVTIAATKAAMLSTMGTSAVTPPPAPPAAKKEEAKKPTPAPVQVAAPKEVLFVVVLWLPCGCLLVALRLSCGCLVVVL